MPERSLKSQNWVYVTPYIIFNVIAFYVVVTGTDDVWRLTETALTSVAWSVASGFTALILNGILGGDFKAILVFWRIKHALPRSGERRVGKECRSRLSPYHLKKK